MPLLAVVANSSLWPLWFLISLGGVVFPFLLCPVYINFISRMQLAWSLDRQVPEWFGNVSERLRGPLNAIIATLVLTGIFLFFQSYKDLPTFLATTGHKLNLAGTAWFSIVMAILTWTLPGFNAILVRFRRPDLVRNAPFGKALPWIGLAWLVFPIWIYIFAVIKPIVNALKGGSALTYLETNGIIDAAIFYLIGIVIYFIMRYRAAKAGVDEKMLFTETARLATYPEPTDRHPSLHRQRLPRRREGMAEVPERDHDEHLQGGRGARRRRPHGQGDRPDHRAERPLRDGAVRCPPSGERRRRAGAARARHRRRRLLLVHHDRPRKPSGSPRMSRAATICSTT